jgi:hypothetical protein
MDTLAQSIQKIKEMETLRQYIQNIRDINNKQKDRGGYAEVEQHLTEIERLMGVSHKGTILLIEMPESIYNAMDESFTSKHSKIISRQIREME